MVAMGGRILNRFQFFTPSVSFRVWAGSRAAAICFGILLIWLAFQMKPLRSPIERPTIEGIAVSRLELEPLPEPVIRPVPQQRSLTEPRDQPKAATPDAAQPLADRPTPRVSAQSETQSVPATNRAPNGQPAPRVASNPNGTGVPSAQAGQGTNSNPTTPRLGGGTMAILRARECARLDIRDRPADCPPNEELARLLANERGPRYRPENAEGFSRNELAWRGIPPPCLDDGENAAIKGTKLCVRIGNVPSRVRSVREICEARGLGGCEDAPSQAAVNAAVEQVRRQEATRAAKP
jgi:hypothetical protein